MTRKRNFSSTAGQGSSRSCTIMLYKPYGVLCTFTDAQGRSTLADYVPVRHVYAAGRLDRDSEGLLILTSDGALAHRLTSPDEQTPKTYLVQVERVPDPSALERLRKGVVIQGRRTRPARVRVLQEEPEVPARTVPIRFRKSVPTAWLELVITEGMNRQVRRMTAQIGHPTLRLIRVGIGPIFLGNLSPGAWRVLQPEELRALWGHGKTSRDLSK